MVNSTYFCLVNDFLKWAWRKPWIVRVLIWISFTAMFAGILSSFLSGYFLLAAATIASAYFAAILFPRIKKDQIDQESVTEDEEESGGKA